MMDLLLSILASGSQAVNAIAALGEDFITGSTLTEAQAATSTNDTHF